mgnify:CR=1 FL=1
MGFGLDSVFGGGSQKVESRLPGYKEDAAKDVFIAWFPCRGGSITAAWVNLGNVVSKADQMGWYLSGQWNF